MKDQNTLIAEFKTVVDNAVEYNPEVKSMTLQPAYTALIASLDKPEQPLTKMAEEEEWWTRAKPEECDYCGESMPRDDRGVMTHQCEPEAAHDIDVVSKYGVVEEKKPKKQTLKEIAQDKYSFYKNLHSKPSVSQWFECLSEYLEREDS